MHTALPGAADRVATRLPVTMFRIWTTPLPPAATIWQSGLKATSTKSFTGLPVVMLPIFVGEEPLVAVSRAQVFTVSDPVAEGAEECTGGADVAGESVEGEEVAGDVEGRGGVAEGDGGEALSHSPAPVPTAARTTVAAMPTAIRPVWRREPGRASLPAGCWTG